MNTVSALKLIVLFSGLALASLGAFFLGVALDTRPLALFGFAVGVLVLLVAAGDYTPRTPLSRRLRVAEIVPFTPAPSPADAADRLAA